MAMTTDEKQALADSEQARIQAMSPAERRAAYDAARENECTCWWGGPWRKATDPPILCKRCQYTDPGVIAEAFGYDD